MLLCVLPSRVPWVRIAPAQLVVQEGKFFPGACPGLLLYHSVSYTNCPLGRKDPSFASPLHRSALEATVLCNKQPLWLTDAHPASSQLPAVVWLLHQGCWTVNQSRVSTSLGNGREAKELRWPVEGLPVHSTHSTGPYLRPRCCFALLHPLHGQRVEKVENGQRGPCPFHPYLSSTLSFISPPVSLP